MKYCVFLSMFPSAEIPFKGDVLELFFFLTYSTRNGTDTVDLLHIGYQS